MREPVDHPLRRCVLARRMGLTGAVFGMSRPDILRELFRGATDAAAA
jgi:hypothetical protein